MTGRVYSLVNVCWAGSTGFQPRGLSFSFERRVKSFRKYLSTGDALNNYSWASVKSMAVKAKVRPGSCPTPFIEDYNYAYTGGTNEAWPGAAASDCRCGRLHDLSVVRRLFRA